RPVAAGPAPGPAAGARGTRRAGSRSEGAGVAPARCVRGIAAGAGRRRGSRGRGRCALVRARVLAHRAGTAVQPRAQRGAGRARRQPRGPATGTEPCPQRRRAPRRRGLEGGARPRRRPVAAGVAAFTATGAPTGRAAAAARGPAHARAADPGQHAGATADRSHGALKRRSGTIGAAYTVPTCAYLGWNGPLFPGPRTSDEPVPQPAVLDRRSE